MHSSYRLGYVWRGDLHIIPYPKPADLPRGARLSEPLTWSVGDRILTFGPLLRGAIELAVVLVVALIILARFRPNGAGRPAEPALPQS
jgi:hypothetical protein